MGRFLCGGQSGRRRRGCGTRGVPCVCLFYDPNGALGFLLLPLVVSSRFLAYQRGITFFLLNRFLMENDDVRKFNSGDAIT